VYIYNIYTCEQSLSTHFFGEIRRCQQPRPPDNPPDITPGFNGDALGIDFTRKRLRPGDKKRFWQRSKNEPLLYIFVKMSEGRNSFIGKVYGLFLPSCAVKVRVFVNKFLGGDKNVSTTPFS
jgi:hypothetical protein